MLKSQSQISTTTTIVEGDQKYEAKEDETPKTPKLEPFSGKGYKLKDFNSFDYTFQNKEIESPDQTFIESVPDKNNIPPVDLPNYNPEPYLPNPDDGDDGGGGGGDDGDDYINFEIIDNVKKSGGHIPFWIKIALFEKILPKEFAAIFENVYVEFNNLKANFKLSSDPFIYKNGNIHTTMG